ncbi:hypothetical protein [Phnomibacter ginsenosidimutans]|uniref:Uncharacterized protein n=1 Tax=Phnomibacter ginsenosidimutans TaxID=2676868 RepID=A0A6I6GMJ3_9BACT|nr:hypothetical protein [Phnomibacter ginsenosidimutans]QGW29735.1 hypothetical protein GLV81_17855 [Phnomibacter ginsenosidimutans]
MSLQHLDAPEQFPALAMAAICHAYTAAEARSILQQWMITALIDEAATVDTYDSKRQLADFCEDLQQLLEAIRLLQQQTNRRQKQLLAAMPLQARQWHKTAQQSMRLNHSEKQQPLQLLQQFARQWPQPYVHSTLLNILDSALHQPRLQQHDNILFYRILLAATRIAQLHCNENADSLIQ